MQGCCGEITSILGVPGKICACWLTEGASVRSFLNLSLTIGKKKPSKLKEHTFFFGHQKKNWGMLIAGAKLSRLANSFCLPVYNSPIGGSLTQGKILLVLLNRQERNYKLKHPFSCQIFYYTSIHFNCYMYAMWKNSIPKDKNTKVPWKKWTLTPTPPHGRRTNMEVKDPTWERGMCSGES